MSHLTSQEIQFLNWALNTRNELPKICWEIFPEWLENQASDRVQAYTELMENWLEEFPENFPAEKKVSRKAFKEFEKQITTPRVATQEDNAAWAEAWNNLLPCWEPIHHWVNKGTKPEWRLCGYECKAPAEQIETAMDLYKKSSDSQKIAAQDPFGGHKNPPSAKTV